MCSKNNNQDKYKRSIVAIGTDFVYNYIKVYKTKMSEKPKIRVQVGEMVQGAPYRTMRDASPELQKEYGALLESTRKKVANVTNAASLAAGLLAVDAATNWGARVGSSIWSITRDSFDSYSTKN